MPSVEIKDYNVLIDRQNFFDQQVKNNIRTYNNILKITAGQGDDYATGCLLFYPYTNENYKMIAIDFCEQQALDVDPIPIHQINYIGNLARDGNTTMFFIIEESKETILDFSQSTLGALYIYFTLI